MRKSRRAGFTLIEVMVVVVIIGILSTFVIRNVAAQGDIAKVKLTQGLLDQVAGQVEMFKLQQGRYPDSLQDLVTMPGCITKTGTWPKGGYRRNLPDDAWGNKLIYLRHASSPDREYELVSTGADGKTGGEGYDADLSN